MPSIVQGNPIMHFRITEILFTASSDSIIITQCRSPWHTCVTS
jgi:hypothetical protein